LVPWQGLWFLEKLAWASIWRETKLYEARRVEIVRLTSSEFDSSHIGTKRKKFSLVFFSIFSLHIFVFLTIGIGASFWRNSGSE